MNEELIVWTFDGESAHCRCKRGQDFSQAIRSIVGGVHLIIEEGIEHLPHMMNFTEFYMKGDELMRVVAGSTVTRVMMADSVKTLGQGSFETFGRLEEIAWSKNLESIGDCALAGCKSLGKDFGPTNVIPPSCRYIGPQAFRDTHSVDTIIIPENTEVHPTAFQGSKIWDSSPFNEDVDDPRLLVDWVKFHQHDDYPLHAMFAKTHINSTDIIRRLCTGEEYVYSDIGKRLCNEKDRFGNTPMDYLEANPYAEKIDEMELVRARISRMLKIDGIGF